VEPSILTLFWRLLYNYYYTIIQSEMKKDATNLEISPLALFNRLWAGEELVEATAVTWAEDRPPEDRPPEDRPPEERPPGSAWGRKYEIEDIRRSLEDRN
jgi:hypothetical protein